MWNYLKTQSPADLLINYLNPSCHTSLGLVGDFKWEIISVSYAKPSPVNSCFFCGGDVKVPGFCLDDINALVLGPRALAIGPQHIKCSDPAHPVLDYHHLFSQITGKTQSSFNGLGMIVISVNHMNFWSLLLFVWIT